MHGPQRQWIQPIRNGLQLMRAHSVTFSMIGHGKGCGCNNNAIFSDRAIFTFPTVAVC